MSRISSETAPHHCRTCLQNLVGVVEDNSAHDRWYHLQQTPELRDWIQELTPTLQTLDVKHYPQYVCNECYRKLKGCHEFRDLVQSSASVFDALYGERDKMSAVMRIKEEQEEEEADLDFENRLNMSQTDSLTHKIEVDHTALAQQYSDDNDDDIDEENVPIVKRSKHTEAHCGDYSFGKHHRVANKRKAPPTSFRVPKDSGTSSSRGSAQSLRDLLVQWELSCDGFKALEECRILSSDILKMITSRDIECIFNKRDLMADRIKFRYNLAKWQINPGIPNASAAQIPLPERSMQPAEHFKVEDILKSSVLGEAILENKNHILKANDQRTIVQIIVDHFLIKNIKMTPAIMKLLAEQIKQIFPLEDEHTYYIPRTKGSKMSPSGKIFDRYFNVVYKLKKLVNPNSNENVLDSATSCENKEKKPPELLTVWPKYKVPNGDLLINVDFAHLYPDKQNLLFEKIDQMEMKFKEIFLSESIKEKQCLEQYKQMFSPDISTDSRYYNFFMLIHTVLLPPRLRPKKKPTIADAQRDMLVHLKSVDSFAQTVDELKSAALSEKFDLLPKVFVVGETPDRLKEFYIFLDDYRFKVSSLLHAIDLVIKLCVVLHLQYSQKSKFVWLFLQEYIYEIPSDVQISKIRNIVSKMHNHYAID